MDRAGRTRGLPGDGVRIGEPSSVSPHFLRHVKPTQASHPQRHHPENRVELIGRVLLSQKPKSGGNRLDGRELSDVGSPAESQGCGGRCRDRKRGESGDGRNTPTHFSGLRPASIKDNQRADGGEVERWRGAGVEHADVRVETVGKRERQIGRAILHEFATDDRAGDDATGIRRARSLGRVPDHDDPYTRFDAWNFVTETGESRQATTRTVRLALTTHAGSWESCPFAPYRWRHPAVATPNPPSASAPCRSR